MANSGPNTNGSQFFIMHIDYPLPPSYTKFGKVIEGQSVIDEIANVQTSQNDKPAEPVVMNRVYIEDAA
jgi:cyclophilin family peptidyl-prolyl cis-trans isomerase